MCEWQLSLRALSQLKSSNSAQSKSVQFDPSTRMLEHERLRIPCIRRRIPGQESGSCTLYKLIMVQYAAHLPHDSSATRSSLIDSRQK